MAQRGRGRRYQKEGGVKLVEVGKGIAACSPYGRRFVGGRTDIWVRVGRKRGEERPGLA